MITRVIFLAILIVACQAKRFNDDKAHWQEFEEFLEWKKTRELREPEQTVQEDHEIAKIIEEHSMNPPPVDQAALMARYIVNQVDWTSVATISTRKEIESFPTANLISLSDGPVGNGAGVPYMYLTPRDFTAQDLAKDHRATLLMSLAQSDYCKEKQWDPMDPRCARVLLTGKIKALKNGTDEHDVAKTVFFERHPKLVNMPANHHFFFAKLKILSVVVLDTFGGPKYVSVKDYLNPPVANVTAEFIRLFPVNQYENESVTGYKPSIRVA